MFSVDSGAPVFAICTAATGSESCTATYPAAALTATTHTITVSVAADTNYNAASGTGTLTVTSIAPTIGFAVPGHTYGDAPFAVSASSNSTGGFTYRVVSGAATISGNTVTLNGVGTVTLLASEAADTNYNAASQQVSFAVVQAPLTEAANNATRAYGLANPTFTGTVTGQKYSDTFSESFTTTATTTSAVGSYAIVPSATGANLGDYSVTATNGTLTITQAATTTVLTASSATINPNQNVTLTATVASTTSGTPTGTVTFRDNGTVLATASLTNGSASYSTELSPGITHSLTASYSGDTNFLSSASAAAGTPVTDGQLSFTLSGNGPGDLTVAPGAVASYSFVLSPNFGSYPGPVAFSVTGLPPGATATFSPASLAANAGAQTVTMSVQTAAAVARNNSKSPLGRGTAPTLMALLLMPFAFRRKLRAKLNGRLLTVLFLLGGLAGVAGITGCGTGSSGFLLQQPQTYNLTVTVSSGSLQQSQAVTLTVQ